MRDFLSPPLTGRRLAWAILAAIPEALVLIFAIGSICAVILFAAVAAEVVL